VNYSDHNSIISAGKQACIDGKSNLDCPIDKRVNANAACLWLQGWSSEAAITCKGTGCSAKNGVGHSQECIDEHGNLYKTLKEQVK
jgi:ribosome modulation factor